MGLLFDFRKLASAPAPEDCLPEQESFPDFFDFNRNQDGVSSRRPQGINMKLSRLFGLLCAALLLSVMWTAPASAQATRTWVSGVGDDANPCSRTAPCKTFAGAISKTAAGGEIDALDPGGFGALTITKSITIDGGGGQVASVLVAGTNGIVVAAGAGDVVILRNMRFDGLRGA